MTLPEHIGASDSGPIREQLLELLNRGADVLIADMTGTLSSDRSGADALLHVYQRASASGAQLRIAVTAPVVRRVLEAGGLDRLVSIYPSPEAAVAAGTPGVIPLVPRPGPGREEDQARSRRRGPAVRDASRTGITPAMLWGLIDALDDGVILSNDDGMLVLANRRADEMFGYRPGELIGQPVESLVPGDLRAAHIAERAKYARDPVPRPMGSRIRLAGQRKDGSTFPARVTLGPVATATGRFILGVIRDITTDQPRADLAELARAAAAADDARRGRSLLSRVVDGMLRVGLSLQTAIELPHEVAVQQIADALSTLDDAIREIHDHVFPASDQDSPPDPPPPSQARLRRPAGRRRLWRLGCRREPALAGGPAVPAEPVRGTVMALTIRFRNTWMVLVAMRRTTARSSRLPSAPGGSRYTPASMSETCQPGLGRGEAHLGLHLPGYEHPAS